MGQVMTHKCMGSIVVLSISKSVEPNEEQKEMILGIIKAPANELYDLVLRLRLGLVHHIILLMI